MHRIDPEARFLAAIAEAAARQLGTDHPLALAAREAATSAAGAGVQGLLAELDAASRDRILAAAHKAMREDVQAIWRHLPGAARSGGMH
jgi:chaperone required for assembly of F1-ATPase